ncbi:MAG: hypothetical protein JOY96_02525, partial [Verrucomicrobia bacterium]|nr:hypothetical protein [Verrucomicrobiota bacterium]
SAILPDFQAESCPEILIQDLRTLYGSVIPYCRWWIAQTLPRDGRVCFLDCDILVEGDLAGLFDSELNNCPIGSVAESVLGIQLKSLECGTTSLRPALRSKVEQDHSALAPCDKTQPSGIFHLVTAPNPFDSFGRLINQTQGYSLKFCVSGHDCAGGRFDCEFAVSACGERGR